MCPCVFVCVYARVCPYVCQVSADWERASLHAGSQPSSVYKASPPSQGFTTDAGFINTTLAADEESQEFDDLIFALKTGRNP